MRRASFLLLFLLLGSLLTAPVRAAGTAGYAVHFDGATTYVQANDSASLDLTTAFTIIVLARIDTYPESGATNILIKQNALNHVFWLLSDGRIGTEIYNGSSYFSAVSTTPVSLGQTHFLVSRFDSSTGELSVSVDLKTVASRADLDGITIATNSNPLLIGKNVWNGVYFDGKIYLVLIYNRALSDSEIQAIYADPTHPRTVSCSGTRLI